ncbi:PadR family transcriptional regulator [Micromonospora radicis]|uniref:PadR family transcriptional regulator n=1 Tax=Micromonospora radicis TaxID=1894971 RepID=A0A418MTN0_9ACTN|nr:PadR family transcriptional regulator [Micromonospora radicis]RIV37428.1 PadR family transcriptional regulator [Micromonospora radicis]
MPGRAPAVPDRIARHRAARPVRCSRPASRRSTRRADGALTDATPRLFGVRPLAFGQMYTTLARMLRDGYIAEAAHERAGGSDRVAYRLTRHGRIELDGWLSQAVPPAVHVSPSRPAAASR